MVNIDKTFGDDWSLQANVGASINNVKTDELSYRGPNPGERTPERLQRLRPGRHEEAGREDGLARPDAVPLRLGGGGVEADALPDGDRPQRLGLADCRSPSSSFFYPSVGLSWVPTSLWDPGEALNYLKIRGSIASVGMPFPRYLTIPTYEYDATNRVWKDKTHYPIGDLKPERTTTYELGLDARLWRHISLSASWYQADTKNQTFDPSLPPSSSYTTIYLQTGHVRNTGVELSAGMTTVGDFRWATNFTYSWNRNEIIELAANAVNPVTGEPLNLEGRSTSRAWARRSTSFKEGGTLGDLYTTSDLRFNDNGYVEVDKSGNLLLTDEGTTSTSVRSSRTTTSRGATTSRGRGESRPALHGPASAASATRPRRPTSTCTAFRRLRPRRATPEAF